MAGFEPGLAIKGNQKKHNYPLHYATLEYWHTVTIYDICNFWKTESLSKTWHQSLSVEDA